MRNPVDRVMGNEKFVSALISEVTAYGAMEGFNVAGIMEGNEDNITPETLGLVVRLITPILLEILTTFANHKPVPNGVMEIVMNGSNDDFKELLCMILGDIDEDEANVIINNLKIVRGNVENYGVVLDSLISKLEG